MSLFQHSASPAPETIMQASPMVAATPHFTVGQLFGTILLGAEDALVAYTNPTEILAAVQNFTQGVFSIWFPVASTTTPPTTTTTTAPPATPAS